jgi:hypothetical protein
MAFKMHCPKCGGLDFSIERDNRTFGAVAQAYELVFHCRCGKQLFGEVLLKEYEAQKKAWEERAESGVDAQGTPDMRVQRIEDRLRTGKSFPRASEEGFGRRLSASERWKDPADLDDEDGDEDLDGDGDGAPASVRMGKAAGKAKGAADGGKAKAPPVAKARAGGAARKKAAGSKAKAARPAARPKAKATPSRTHKKDTRRPDASRLKAAARTSASRKPARASVRPKGGAARGRGHEEHGICIWPGCGKPARANSKYCSRACSNKNARSRHKTRARKATAKKSPRTSRSAKGR